MIKSTETDWNRDGVLDYIDFDIEMPLQDHEIIYGVQLHMLFDFKLYVLVFSHTLLFFFRKFISVSEIQSFSYARTCRCGDFNGTTNQRNGHQWRP